jgi:hypothetical protein
MTTAVGSTALPRWWVPVVDFAVHAIVGTAIFAIVAGPAVFIDWALGHYVKVTLLTKVGLIIAEYALFGVDIVLFLRFLFVSASRAWKSF